MFEAWPFTNFHDLNLDWIIKTIKRLDKDVQEWKIGLKEYVLELLSDHPEWIQDWMLDDGSVTNAKFANEVFWYVTPEMFGAVGDGVTDDTDALQAMLDSDYHAFKLNQKTYITTKPLVINDERKHIEGLGHNSVIRKVGVTNLGDYRFTINGTTTDISAVDAVLVYAPTNGYNGDDDGAVKWYDYAGNFDIQRSDTTSTSGRGVVMYYRGFPEMENVKIHKCGRPLTLFNSYGGHFNNITTLETMNTAIAAVNSTSMTFTDTLLSTLGGDYNVYADNSQIQFTNLIVDFGMIRAINNSILEVSNLRTECQGDIAHAESGSTINISGGNIEYHYEPGVTVNALFVADAGNLTVNDAVLRYQNYSGSADPADVKLYYCYNTSYLSIDTVFKNFPTLTYDLQSGSEAYVNKLNQATGTNETLNNRIAFTWEAAVDTGDVDSSRITRTGSTVEIRIYCRLTNTTSAGTPVRLITLPSEVVPPTVVRTVGYSGADLNNTTHLCYLGVGLNGAVYISPWTSGDRYVIANITYQLPWNEI